MNFAKTFVCYQYCVVSLTVWFVKIHRNLGDQFVVAKAATRLHLTTVLTQRFNLS